ncbi:hypothetical protein ACFQZE_11520 [Paenibacillus sp. GCM10027627]|uniref:hypothetical protein n=1 Tax=unclassified Paenibacillus TaxID=185978 RepID=UPI00362B1E2C
MSGYIRSIRNIEQSKQYIMIQPSLRSAAYRLQSSEMNGNVRSFEEQEGYHKAAASVASWLNEVGRASKNIDDLLQKLGRNGGIEDRAVLESSLAQIKGIILQLGQVYRSHQTWLKPEIWEAMELALRHPAVSAFNLKDEKSTPSFSPSKGQNSERGNRESTFHRTSLQKREQMLDQWGSREFEQQSNQGLEQWNNQEFEQWNNRGLDQWNNQGLEQWNNQGLEQWNNQLPSYSSVHSKSSADHSKSRADHAKNSAANQPVEAARRLLLGADGWLNELKHALSYSERFKPVELLRQPFFSAYPYAMYYGSAQAYFPLPIRGAVLNKYV